ncbi:hypothetical protein COJ96_06040 [Bacillus sp. AFS073361]|uniref:hypothetical protein n=1 Tax=Bacillus sp. AFS073361 TaxID=2033511 RepID=UPI000BF7EB9A|nr:hypothetical protein [Bacillus sp. AFS073361]PFP30270.1 hypothetical protein COJ96_06040 [Bacillus sp. AFS073361]
MPDLTPRIGIKKPLGNENVSRASFNENWDILDAKVATNAFSSVAGKTGGSLSTVVADSPSDTLTIEGLAPIQVSADVNTDTITVSLETPTPVNLTLQNGTTVYSDRTPRYIKDGYAVELDGAVIATGGGVTLATLPAGYRPPKTQIFKVAQNWSATNDGATIYVNPDGTVILLVAASYAQAISLCGIRFYTI